MFHRAIHSLKMLVGPLYAPLVGTPLQEEGNTLQAQPSRLHKSCDVPVLLSNRFNLEEIAKIFRPH